MKRRKFLQASSAALASLPITLSGFSLFASAAPKPLLPAAGNSNDKILVLVQLQGGNDGLSTLYDASQYANLSVVRNNILVPESSIINVEGNYGFHPAMQGMKDLWDTANLSIIQNVGYPNQNRSHFRSMDIWNTGSSAEDFLTTGWIGRFYDLNYSDYPNGYPNTDYPHPFALTMGKIVSETCQGINANYSLSLLDPFNPGTALVGAGGDIPTNCYGDALTFVNETVAQTNAFSEVITNAANAGNNLSTKWDSLETELAQKLKNVARLIAGGLQTKIYIVQLGGFDTHDNQVVGGSTSTGLHSQLLQTLSDAVCAFQNDLNLLGISEKVIGMTYSEFGRRIRSNAALGTDHGTAAPLFMFGSCVNNQILGTHPIIDPEVGIEEGVTMEYDFRDIYGTVLQQWLGLPESEITNILHPTYAALPLISSACSITTDDTIVRVCASVQLQGAYNTDTNLMETDLLNANLIPLAQPFNTIPWNYAGTESMANLSSFPSNTVDWVLLELREGTNGNTLVERRAALLLADGNIVDVEDFGGVRFYNVNSGESYYVAIRARNHLAVMSNIAYSFPNTNIINLSNPSNVLEGFSQLATISTNVYALFCGDYDNDGVITVNDFNRYKEASAAVNVYTQADGSMDGNVTVNDFNLYQPNASIIGVQQIRY